MATVKFFGWAKDLAGMSEASLTIPDGSGTAEAWEIVINRFASLAPHRASFLLAVNRRYAGADTVVNDNDEVAVIPPVSGG